MRALFIYNPYDSSESQLIDKIKEEVLASSVIDEFQAVNFMEVKDIFKIQQTPAIIFIREDLQGASLLTEDVDTGKFRLTLEILKQIEEEEKVIHNVENHRIDFVVNSKINEKVAEVQDSMVSDMVERGII